MAARVANMEFVDELVGAFTAGLSKAELCPLLQARKVPHAPVRALSEVMQDPVLHERGMLIEVDHPAYGRVTLHNSPLRFADTERQPYACSPAYGQHNEEVLPSSASGRRKIEALHEEGAV